VQGEVKNLPQGRRSRKITTASAPQGAGTVIYTYDLYDRLKGELDGAGNPLRTYVWRFNIPESVWNKMSEVERWGANQKFLDRMISRGDDVILATPLDKVRPGSYFARALEYMSNRGYVPSADGTQLILHGGR